MKIKEAVELLKDSPDYLVIEKFEGVDTYNTDPDARKLIGIYVDTETTGFDPGKDKVIELSMVSFEFNPDGRIFRILDKVDLFQDPGFPIPEEIVRLTGLTDKMVAGHVIDAQQVADFIAPAAVVIAHNAGFDRPFCEQITNAFIRKAWACSYNDIPWSDEDVPSAKLEYLAYRFGFFFDGHRAINDVLAGIHILSKDLPKTGTPVLKAMLDKARMEDVRIRAEGSPFEAKDTLKARGYKWHDGSDGHPKAWCIDIPREQSSDEIDYLRDQIFGYAVEPPMSIINAYNRYSARV